MSDNKRPSSIEEMFNLAEKSQEYSELNAHLQTIKNRLRDTANKPTPEQIQSAYEFVRLLKERTWAKELQEAYTKASTRAELNNLKDEIAVYQEIEGELKKMEWVRLSRNAYFWDDAKKIVYFGLKRIDDNNFIIEAANEDWIKLSKSITDLKEINTFIDQVQASDYDSLKVKGLSHPAQKSPEPAKAAEAAPAKPKKKSKWIEFIDGQKVDETKISMPKDELELYKKYLSKSADFDDIDLDLAIPALIKAKTAWKSDLKFSDWEKLGYADTFTFTRKNTQLKILNDLLKEISADNAKLSFISTLNAYKSEWMTIKDYEREMQSISQFKSSEVFDYLSSIDERTSPLSKKQLLYLLSANNETMVYAAISKIILTWGWAGLRVSSKAELYDALKCNPILKAQFQKWLYRVTASWLDIGEYIAKWWDTKDQLDRINKFSESVWIELDKLFNEKFTKAINERIAQVKADPKYNGKEKERNEILSKLENAKSKDETSIRNFFKIKAIWLVWSLIKWKEWAGWLIVIWNNSTNEIIRKIDFEVGLWSFGWNILPVVGFSISESTDVTSRLSISGRWWVWIFGAYVIGSADYQINYSSVENAKIEWFNMKKRSLWAYWDAGITFFWGVFSYGWWVQYKERLSEWFRQKRWMLEKTLNSFSKVKSLSELDALDMKMTNKEEESTIKQDFKNILLWLGYSDNLTTAQKNALISAAKQSKLSDFDKACAMIWDKEWLTFAGIWLWVQFIAGFFPIIVGWFSVEKNSLKKEKSKNFRPVELKSSENHSVNAEAISRKFEKLWVKMDFDEKTWFYRLSPLSALKEKLNIYATDAAKANLKIEGNVLVLGQVGSMFYNEGLGTDALDCELYLWGTSWSELDISSPEVAASLQKNTPTSYITYEETFTTERRSFESWRIRMMYDDYLKSNSSKFNETMLDSSSPNWMEYNRFRYNLSQWKLNEARTALLNFLNNYAKYSKKSSAETKKVIEHIKLINDNFELAKTLADFKDILMVDIYTRTRKFNTQEELDAATDKIMAVLNKRWIPEKLAKADTVAKQQKLIASLNREELSALKKTTWWLDTQNMEGKKDLNRKGAFWRLSKRFLWSNADAVIAARGEQDTYKRQHLTAWWVPMESKNVFALVWSYKVASGPNGKPTNLAVRWRERYSSKGLDAMPPGTVSIADNKKSEIKNSDTKALLDDFASRTIYFEMVRQSLLSHINANLTEKISDKDFTTDKLKELILNKKVEINWKKIEMKSSFVFFMYWECNNESIWLEFWEITLDIKGKKQKIVPVSFGEWSNTETQNVWIQTIDYTLWMLWGKGREAVWANPNNNTTTPWWTQWTGTGVPDTWWASF
ncbi:MAG: hypothetical protein ACD_2C00220G0003 [uncultured bacterium (gcode 4)]|uniref:Uncharacterized protein n=1 Tax=uncultured bacterium (gcode 4) TaxID=1234023 RepID=K2H081_9BACT|nr:MAG: hypothetical protein ACD_2C00220G0003 [uncultured bacterium (gcode 4)]